MVNKPKRMGTFAESAVAAFLIENGWPYAERRALQGLLDKGDIAGTPGLCWEVKSCSRANVPYSTYLRECEIERVNASAQFGITVVKTAGMGVTRIGQWLAVMYFDDLIRLDSAWDLTIAVKDKQLIPGEVVRHERFKHPVPSIHVFCPPGKKDSTGQWYAFTTLERMTQMLRGKGFGEPLEALTSISDHP